MAAARIAAKAKAIESVRQAKLLKQAQSDEQKLHYADSARKQGDVALAALLYGRLASSRQKNDYTTTAKERITTLQDDGRRRLRLIDQALASAARESTPKSASEGVKAAAVKRETDIKIAFEQFHDLNRQYRRVPVIGREITRHVSKKRREDQYARVLREEEAGRLWQRGRKEEAGGQLCCAMLTYEKAARLAPAPSGEFARDRYETLKQDPKAVAAAKQCRELQWCHRTYRQAEMLAKIRPSTAKGLFKQILKRAPSDSKIHRSARQQVDELASS